MVESSIHRGLGLFPGGAPSQLRRMFHTPEPLLVSRAEGPWLWDASGSRYLDLNLAFGAIVLGHGDPEVVNAVTSQAKSLILHGAGVSVAELEAAERISRLMPFAERIVFTPSGSEAVLLAIRLARAYTGRSRVVKFEGNYHGWHDYSLYNVSTPLAGGKHAETEGIPHSVAETIDVLPYNDASAFEDYMERHGDEVAAVIMEPVAHSMGVVPAEPEWVRLVERLTRSHGALLVMDEIITAVRHSLRGLQTELGVRADLTTIGKAIGNGMPVAALVGRSEVMDLIAANRVVSSGTYQAHPLSMAAVAAVLDKMERLEGDRLLARVGAGFCSITRDLVEDLGIDAYVACYRSILSIYFGLREQPRSLSDVVKADARSYRVFAESLRRQGVLVNPNPRKRLHFSLAHSDPSVVEKFQATMAEALRRVKDEAPPGRRLGLSVL